MKWSALGRNRYGANGYSFTSLLYFYITNECHFYIISLTNYYVNPPLFQLTCAVSNIRRWTLSTGFQQRLTVITERDFKCEYLFRMCSVVTNLATWLEFQPISCATMLCHFGRTRNGYVVIRFILLSSTAEGSATSGYVVAPERSG